MSFNEAIEPNRYTQPEIESRIQTKYDFGQLKVLNTNSQLNVQPSFSQQHTIDRNDYPISGKHSRVPILINC